MSQSAGVKGMMPRSAKGMALFHFCVYCMLLASESEFGCAASSMLKALRPLQTVTRRENSTVLACIDGPPVGEAVRPLETLFGGH